MAATASHPAPPPPSFQLDAPAVHQSEEQTESVNDCAALLEQGKQVLMYCTGGIRCEKASACDPTTPAHVLSPSAVH